jgi:putative radical SAM enzyme (TIGR03279 family)
MINRQNVGLKIVSVPNRSVFAKFGISAEDILLAVNGVDVQDELDVKFYGSEDTVNYKFKLKDGQIRTLTIQDTRCDLEFEPMEIKNCCNKCVFCFVDQMPPAMRKTLYIKDEDYRLSFLQGTYISLTSLTFDDVDRIIKMKLSPLYVSVHTTDPDLRVSMMRNKNAGKALEYLKTFIQNGIRLHTQIVIIPGFNDGLALTRTLDDLSNLAPNVMSIAVVPVGLTKYRTKLSPISNVSKVLAKEIMAEINTRQKEMQKEYGYNVIYASDEMYILAEQELPAYEQYDDFYQIENGVGMIRQFQSEIQVALASRKWHWDKASSAIITGELGYKIFEDYYLQEIRRKYTFSADVIAVKNEFFGDSVTVSGLLTAEDILSQMRLNYDYKRFILPGNMFNDEGLTLDDYKIEDFTSFFQDRQIFAPNNGQEFVQVLFRGGKK